MWLELTDSLGHRTLVNMDLVVSLKAATDGNSILETCAHLHGALHALVVRESLDEIVAAMESRRRLDVRDAETTALASVEGADFVSDGNEG